MLLIVKICVKNNLGFVLNYVYKQSHLQHKVS